MPTLAELYTYYCKRTGCRPNTKFVDQLTEDETHTKFDFSNNYVGPKGIVPVWETARNNMNLTSLDVSNNWLDQEAVSYMVKALMRHPTLTKISLANNPIHLSCCKDLLHLLANNFKIVELDVSSTEIVPSMIKRLAEAAATNHQKRGKEQAEIQAEKDIATNNRLKHMQGSPLPSECPSNVAIGEWVGGAAGGCTHFSSWRDNPQYLLYPSEPGLLTVRLTQKPKQQSGVENKPTYIGLIVAEGDGVRRVLHLNSKNLIAESQHTNTEVARVQASLERRVRGQHNPYVLIPTTFYPGRETSFEITVVSQRDDGRDTEVYSLEPVNSSFDWFRAPPIKKQWTATCSGGSRKYSSWRSNEQFSLSFRDTTKTHGTVFILLTKSDQEDDNDERKIGFTLSKGQPYKGKRWLVPEDEIVAETGFHHQSQVHMKMDLPANENGYIIIPSTERPNQLGDYILTVYATHTVQVESAGGGAGDKGQWYEATFTGEWDESSNGGCRTSNPRSWVNNMCFALPLQIRSDILVLLQKHDNGKTTSSAIAALEYRDPSTRNAFDDISIGLVLCLDDGDLTEVKRSTFVKEGEAALLLSNLPPRKEKYLLLPCTYAAGDHCEYSLHIYSTHPLDTNSFTSTLISERIKAKRFARYEEENKEREDLGVLPMPDPKKINKNADTAKVDDEDDVAAAKMRQTIIDAYVQTGRLYIDREFPAGPSSLYVEPDDASPSVAPNLAEWKRPGTGNFLPEAQLFTNGLKAGDVQQGELENTWFLGMLSVVAVTRPDLLENAFVSSYPEYGFYQVRFFQFGRWQTQTIDNFFPVDSIDNLVFGKSCDLNELWVSVVEKAYAKLYGSYEALSNGKEADGLTDLTGGITQAVLLTHQSVQQDVQSGAFWKRISTAQQQQGCILACVIKKDGVQAEGHHNLGLLYNKAYGIVDCREIEGNRLVRMRNPWGIMEWRGRFHDNSAQWTKEMLTALNYEFADDGTFWMPFSDLCKYFTTMYICHVPPPNRERVVPSPTRGYVTRIYGEWSTDLKTAGGCLDNVTWPNNKQFTLSMSPAPQQPEALLISLTQPSKYKPYERYHEIGFYCVETNDNTRKITNLSTSNVVMGSDFVQQRTVSLEVVIKPKYRYVIIPVTKQPNVDSQFLITVGSKYKSTIEMVVENATVVMSGSWRGPSCGGKPPTYGTWRHNPQYLLFPSAPTLATVSLKKKDPTNHKDIAIGMVILTGKTIQRTLELVDDQVIATVPHTCNTEVNVTINVEGVQQRRGLPYVIIPSTEHPTQTCDFELSVTSNRRMQLSQVDQNLDWVENQVAGSWSTSNNTAGGCLTYASWRENTQYTLHFTEPSARLFVILAKVLPYDQLLTDDTEITFVIARCSTAQGGRRKKLAVDESDVVATATGKGDHIYTNCVLPANGLDGYVVIPSTRYPDIDLNYNLTMYSSCQTTFTVVQPHDAWFVSHVEGRWQPGHTAGGRRENSWCWRNNPWYGLSLRHPTTVVILLTQLPRDRSADVFAPPPQTKAAKQIEQKKCKKLRLVPTSGREGNVNIAVDVCIDDDPQATNPTHIVTSRYTTDSEVLVALPKLQPGATPYLIVPHTYDQEEDASFRLTVYTDLQADVFPIEKEKKPTD